MLKPIEGQCPVCDSVFAHIPRAQGGGKRRIYCAARCRSLDWIRGNGGKRKASVIKYDENPENKVKKRERSRKDKLKKYGISDEVFFELLATQKHECRGCFRTLDRYSARIDHNHTTGKVRGLLCDSCNWAIGHAKDDSLILLRLSQYLS